MRGNAQHDLTEQEIADVIGGTKQNVDQYVRRSVRWLWRQQVTENVSYIRHRLAMNERAAKGNVRATARKLTA